MIDRTFDRGQQPSFVAAIAPGSIEIHREAPRTRSSSTSTSSREKRFRHQPVRRHRHRAPPRWWGRLGRSESSTRIRVEVPPAPRSESRARRPRSQAEVRLAEAFIDTASGDVSLTEVRDAKIKSASGDLPSESSPARPACAPPREMCRIGDMAREAGGDHRFGFGRRRARLAVT